MKFKSFITALLLVCFSLFVTVPKAWAEAYSLRYWYCYPPMEAQIYAKATAVKLPDQSWKLMFGYYGFTNATVRISVYGFTGYDNGTCLDSKVYNDVVIASWTTFVPVADIYYEVLGTIVILRNGQPVDSASVTLSQ